MQKTAKGKTRRKWAGLVMEERGEGRKEQEGGKGRKEEAKQE